MSSVCLRTTKSRKQSLLQRFDEFKGRLKMLLGEYRDGSIQTPTTTLGVNPEQNLIAQEKLWREETDQIKAQFDKEQAKLNQKLAEEKRREESLVQQQIMDKNLLISKVPEKEKFTENGIEQVIRDHIDNRIQEDENLQDLRMIRANSNRRKDNNSMDNAATPQNGRNISPEFSATPNKDTSYKDRDIDRNNGRNYSRDYNNDRNMNTSYNDRNRNSGYNDNKRNSRRKPDNNNPSKWRIDRLAEANELKNLLKENYYSHVTEKERRNYDMRENKDLNLKNRLLIKSAKSSEINLKTLEIDLKNKHREDLLLDQEVNELNKEISIIEQRLSETKRSLLSDNSNLRENVSYVERNRMLNEEIEKVDVDISKCKNGYENMLEHWKLALKERPIHQISSPSHHWNSKHSVTDFLRTPKERTQISYFDKFREKFNMLGDARTTSYIPQSIPTYTSTIRNVPYQNANPMSYSQRVARSPIKTYLKGVRSPYESVRMGTSLYKPVEKYRRVTDIDYGLSSLRQY